MTRIALAALVLLALAAGCAADTREPPSECRCRFDVDGTHYDVPCGTTICAGTIPAVCSPEGEGAQLGGTCDPDDSDTAILGVCETDVRESNCGLRVGDCTTPPAVSDCTYLRTVEGCLDWPGCTWRNADCVDTPDGCQAFVE